LFDVQLTSPPGPDGKIPPPQKGGESDRIRPGTEIIPPIEIEGLGKIGMEICYDIRSLLNSPASSS
jgi:predicted amidohydrolase